MRPTFILTRAFAISALFVGAAQLSYAAPITEARVPSVVVAGVDAIGIVLTREVPIEVRAPIDMDTIKRVDDDAVEARSAEPEPEPDTLMERNCNSFIKCRRERE